MLTSCNPTDDTVLQADNEFHLTCFRSAWNDLRISTEHDGSGCFTEGDRIDVVIHADDKTTNKQMEYIGQQWMPALKHSDYAANELYLSATYPTLPSTNGNIESKDISLPADQSSNEGLNNADILFGSTTINATSSSATLQFHHALHRININLKGSVPENLEIAVRSLPNGQISTLNGHVTTNQSSNYTWLKPYKRDNNTYTVIILPQDAKAYQSGDGLIRLTYNGKDFTYALNSNIESFQPEMQTTINLTLKQNGSDNPDDDFSNQTRWVYGITSPAFPGKDHIKSYWTDTYNPGEWFRIAYEIIDLPNEEEYLTWNEGCGWYDCNKTFDYNGDFNMCWAAMASNLLHWWIEHNKKYIEAYESEFNDTPCPKGYQVMTAKNQEHSEVFNFFKASFPDRGNWDTGGVNWFINGNTVNMSNYNENFKGFFYRIFSKKDTVAYETRNTSKTNFNKWIKNAFLHNKAIGFSALGFTGPTSGRHSMTIWGAEFDAEGNVSYLYFCDNNYGADEPNHGSIRRFKVTYNESTTQGTYLVPLDNNDGSQSKAKSLICSLTLVDLRQDIWQAKYPYIK